MNPALVLKPMGAHFAGWSPTFHRYIPLPPSVLRIVEIFHESTSICDCLANLDFDPEQRESGPEQVLALLERLRVAGILVEDAVRRFPSNPIVHPGLHDSLGGNINGPALIRVPEWVCDPLGRYYLYFAHHRGQHIRLAYSNDLHGPWRVHAPGTLHRQQTACTDHIASPEVVVDHRRHRILMYFHGGVTRSQAPGIPQRSFYAESSDGLDFKADAEPLGPFYLRTFRHEGWVYAIAKTTNATSGGVLLRSQDGRHNFESGPTLLPRKRHAAVQRRGDILRIFYSQVEDCPERILMSTMRLEGDWTTWTASPAIDILSPETAYEGALLPFEPSRFGGVFEPVRQLRDPAVFEEDGRTYLVYACAGESGLAMAEVFDDALEG